MDKDCKWGLKVRNLLKIKTQIIDDPTKLWFDADIMFGKREHLKKLIN